MHRTRSKRGFTLLEVLLVVAILVMLAALIVPRLGGTQDRATESITQLRIKRIEQALGAFKIDCLRYPTTDEGLKALITKPEDDETIAEKWKGPYGGLTEEDLKDEWGREIQYANPGEHNEDGYDIWSTGKDADSDESKWIKNWKSEE